MTCHRAETDSSSEDEFTSTPVIPQNVPSEFASSNNSAQTSFQTPADLAQLLNSLPPSILAEFVSRLTSPVAAIFANSKQSTEVAKPPDNRQLRTPAIPNSSATRKSVLPKPPPLSRDSVNGLSNSLSSIHDASIGNLPSSASTQPSRRSPSIVFLGEKAVNANNSSTLNNAVAHTELDNSVHGQRKSNERRGNPEATGKTSELADGVLRSSRRKRIPHTSIASNRSDSEFEPHSDDSSDDQQPRKVSASILPS